MSSTSKRLRAFVAMGTAVLVLTGCGARAGDEVAASAASPAASCLDTSGDTIKLGFLDSLTGGMAISEKDRRQRAAHGRRRDQRRRRHPR